MRAEWRGVPVWVWLVFAGAGVWAGARYLEHRSGSNPLTFSLPLPGRSGQPVAASPMLAGAEGPPAFIPDVLRITNIAPGRVYVPGVGSFDTTFMAPEQSRRLLELQQQATGG